MKKLAIVVAGATLAALTGCGGASSSSAPAPTSSAPAPISAPAPTSASAPISVPAPISAPAPTNTGAVHAAAAAPRPHKVAPVQPTPKAEECWQCGTVQDVHLEKRKGEGGAVGVVSGAVVGGLLGNQVGKGNGKKLATVGGAIAGGFAGNEVEKQVTSKEVWVTKVRMKDGTERTFEHDAKPAWAPGSAVKADGKTLVLL